MPSDPHSAYGSSAPAPVTATLPGSVLVMAGDPMAMLPVEAREKYRKLEQERDDAGLLVRATVADQQQLQIDVQRHRNRIKELQTPRGAGGFGLSDDALQVVQERRALDGKLVEHRRLAARAEELGAKFQKAGEIVRAIEQGVAAHPAGCIGQMVEAETPTLKGRSIIDAIEARRRRVGQLKSDLRRILTAPWPSAMAKKKMRAQVVQLAESGAPRTGSAIAWDEPVAFPTRTYQVQVLNADPNAIGFVELPDVLGLFAWLYRDALVAALDREIDDCADDPSALTGEQRQEAEAEVLADLLAVEREECRLIEIAQAQGQPADYRVDCDPRAILGFEWVAAPSSAARESDGEFGLVRHFGP